MKVQQLSGFLREERSAAGMLTALLIIIFVAVMAIVIDVGHLHSVRNELQNAADAGARAGARALIRMEDYPIVAVPDPPYCQEAREKAVEATFSNKSDGANIQTDINLDVTLGWWDWSQNRFYPKPAGVCSLDDINAVRVVAKRVSSGGTGPVFLTLAKVFGWETADVRASSVAAVGYLKENCTFFLFALLYNSEPNSWFQRFLRGDGYMTMHTGTDKATKSDEGAWADPAGNGYTPSRFIKEYFKGRTVPECMGEGDEVDLQGGVDASILHSIKDKLTELRQTAGTANDQWNHECNGKTYEGWLLLTPLVNDGRLNQKTRIFNPDATDPYGNQLEGFIPVLIKNVYNPNDKNAPEECGPSQGHCVEIAYFPCAVQAQGPPGGTTNLVYATRPKLVLFDDYTQAPDD